MRLNARLTRRQCLFYTITNYAGSSPAGVVYTTPLLFRHLVQTFASLCRKARAKFSTVAKLFL